MEHLKGLFIVLILLLISFPIGEACFIVNKYRYACYYQFRCSCRNDGYCNFGKESFSPYSTHPDLFGLKAWITYDGPVSDTFPNAYGSSYATNDPNSPVPPSSYDGKPCQIRWNLMYALPFMDCSQVFDGKWDASERGCVECQSHKEKEINFAYSSESRDRCESACGASPECDEKIPGTNNCDANCQYTPPTSTTTTTSTSTTTTTSTSTSTTTTIPPTKYCCCYQDCGISCTWWSSHCQSPFVQCLDSYCEVTTTTTTTIPPSKCKTSDPPYCDYSGYPCGDNAKLKGRTTLKDGRTQDDTCIDNKWLKEYYCKTPDDTIFNYKTINCEDYGSAYYCYYGRCISGGGGGCPILKAWDGKDFVEIESLGIHSEEGVDTTVETSFSMEAIDGKYKLLLTEASYLQWEGSHVDSVKLTDETGKECQLVSAEHSKEGNVLSTIAESDDVRIETKPTEEIALTFEGCSGNEFIFSIEGYNRLLVKLGSTEMDIVLILIAVIVVFVVVYGGFNYFVKRK